MADTAQPQTPKEEKEQKNQNPVRCTVSPRISSKETAARDITAKFRSAASGWSRLPSSHQGVNADVVTVLRTGQLVKDENFTLFDAVGALEIMDPKMDSGYLAPGENPDDEYDVLKKLLPGEVVGIMDQLVCFEMAWHMGHPLSQSLFTSSYIDKLLWPEPKTLEQARFDRRGETGQENLLLHLVLRAYCLALVKTCDFVLTRMGKAQYYEEEDFVSNLYHRNLFSSFEDAPIERLLDDALAWISQQDDLRTGALHVALSSRIEFRKAFLLATKPDINSSEPDHGRFWDHCLEALPKLLKTKDLGVAVNSSISTKIQRILASSVPPRPIVSITFDESYVFLHQICQNGKEALRVLDCPDGNSWLNFVWTFMSRTPFPCVYIRCLLQSLITNKPIAEGPMAIKKVIFEDLAQMVLPASLLIDPANDLVEAPHDPRFLIARKLESFVIRAGEAYLEIFQALCMNRSRMRRMLCHLILLWDGLQADAEALDIDLRVIINETPMKDATNEDVWSYPLVSWAHCHLLHQMEWIVQLGFELDIYQLDELAGMYWYLKYLANARIGTLERIREFTSFAYGRILKPTLNESAAFSRSFSFLNFATLEASAVQSFADGLSHIYSFLTYLGLIPSSNQPAPYSTPYLRYCLRMRPFLPISLPEIPPYSDFTAFISSPVEGTHSRTANETMITHALLRLNIADQAMKTARKEWEAISKMAPGTAHCVGCEDWWKDSVRAVVKASIVGNIAVASAKKGLASLGGKNVKEEFIVKLPEKEKRHHAWWVVPSISVR